MDEHMEVMEVTDEQVDAAWNDTDLADQPEQVAPSAAEPESQEQPETPPAPAKEEPAKADQPELFTIKNRDETRQVTRDELVSMAQKGWDYDKVRQERDQLREYRQQADPALEVVRRYAQRSGMNVGDYLDYVRKQELISGGMTEQNAAQTVQLEKERAALNAQQAQIQQYQQKQNSILERARQEREARQKDFGKFLESFPGVDPKSIPKEIWEQVSKGESLVNAYTRHENQRLKAELAAMKQNQKNRTQTPGSLGGASSKEMDEIDRIWAEDD